MVMGPKKDGWEMDLLAIKAILESVGTQAGELAAEWTDAKVLATSALDYCTDDGD